MKLATLVLAAGASRRLGTPKQLVPLDGISLVERAVRAAADLGPVFVVTGAHERAVADAVGGLAVCVHNAQWSEGMGTSVRVGVHAATSAHPDLGGVLVTTCDQPWVDPAHLHALARGLATHAIAASAYGGITGVPAAFSASMFLELGALGGDHGARQVIRREPARVLAIPCANAEHDVDRPEDLRGTC